jgi:hypothetical protein
MAHKQKSGNGKPTDSRDGRLKDYEKVGPTSIEGVEASDLPDKGRGDVSTNISKEAGRRLPQQTGEWETGDTGLKGDPDIADADEHGHEKLI